MQNYSKFQFNSPAIRSNKYLSSFLDHLTTFVLTVLLFFIVHAIFEVTPMVNSKKENVVKAQYNLNKIVIDSKLDDFDDSNYNLIGSDKVTKTYIERLVKTSLIKENYSSISSYYNNVDEIEISKDNDNVNDSLYYYQLMFKSKNINNFKDVSIITSSEYLKKLEEKTSIKFNFIDDYPYLSLDDAKLLDSEIRNDSTNASKKIYSNLYNGYYVYLKESINEIINNYIPYIEAYNLYEIYSNRIFYNRHYELLIAYVLSILIVYLLLPTIFRNGTTLSMKALKQAIVYKSKKEYRAYTDLLRVVYNLFKNVLTLPLIFLIMYSTSAQTLLVSSIIFNIPLIYYPIFSLIIILVSFILSLFKGTNNEMLDEIMFRYNIIDTTSFNIVNKEKVDV